MVGSVELRVIEPGPGRLRSIIRPWDMVLYDKGKKVPGHLNDFQR
jgi:hypothetical protein